MAAVARPAHHPPCKTPVHPHDCSHDKGALAPIAASGTNRALQPLHLLRLWHADTSRKQLTRDLERVSPVESIQTYSAMTWPFWSSFRYLLSWDESVLGVSWQHVESSRAVRTVSVLEMKAYRFDCEIISTWFSDSWSCVAGLWQRSTRVAACLLMEGRHTMMAVCVVCVVCM